MGYSWPGNVRELENSIEHAVVLAKGLRVEVSDFPDHSLTHPICFFISQIIGPVFIRLF